MPEPPTDPRVAGFASLVAHGVTLAEAYRRSFGLDNRFAAARLARKPRIAAAITRHRPSAPDSPTTTPPVVPPAPAARFSVAPSISASVTMTRDELLEWYASAIRTPVSEIDENHPLAYEVVREDGPKSKVRVKSVSKMEAAKALREMCGWNKPEAAGLNVKDALQEALNSLAPPPPIPTAKMA